MKKKLSIKKRIINDFLVATLFMVSVAVLGTTLVNAYANNEVELIVSKNEKNNVETKTSIDQEINKKTNSTLESDISVITPVKLTIPSLSIDADIEYVGISKKGDMMPPNSFRNVGWYKYGALPGGIGNAYIVGHVDNSIGLDGVFKNLVNINKGDLIYVLGEHGVTLTYKVEQMGIVDYQLSLKEAVNERSNTSQLVLITCYGSWVSEEETYDKRFIVVAKQV